MMKKLFKYLSIGLLWFCTLADEAKALDCVQAKTPQVVLQGYTSTAEVNANQDIQVLISFEIKDHWHILSPEPGDIGLPTKVEWSLPSGYALINEQWSLPQVFGEGVFAVYGYGDKAFYLATIRLSTEVLRKTELTAKVSWQACAEECVPQEAMLSFKLPIVEHNVLPNAQWRKIAAEAHETFVSSKKPAIDKADDNTPLWLVMLMAFVGGLILNLMPCVFPILSLKALALIKQVQDVKLARREAWLFFGGVMVSFMVMVSFLAWFRLSGESVGWGFQLQSPWFIFVLLVIFVIIALMFLDIININVPLINRLAKVSANSQKLSSFFTGVFSVVIASPCTAPFMGVAIGYTLTQPVYMYYPVFMSLAVGYALPFTLIGLYPQVIGRIMPKPGKWMATLKHLFAIPVILTCFWLAWIWCVQVFGVSNQDKADNQQLLWRDYNAVEAARMVDAGHNVFIDFTAKWCITCLANEQLALNTPEFAQLVQDKSIILYKADWTNRNEQLTEALAQYGRNSVPLYVYYDGKYQTFHILPQLLTPTIIQENIK